MINVRANKACGRYSEAGIFGVFDFLSMKERHTQQQGTEQSCFCVVVVIIAVVLYIVVAEAEVRKRRQILFGVNATNKILNGFKSLSLCL